MCVEAPLPPIQQEAQAIHLDVLGLIIMMPMQEEEVLAPLLGLATPIIAMAILQEALQQILEAAIQEVTLPYDLTPHLQEEVVQALLIEVEVRQAEAVVRLQEVPLAEVIALPVHLAALEVALAPDRLAAALEVVQEVALGKEGDNKQQKT